MTVRVAPPRDRLPTQLLADLAHLLDSELDWEVRIHRALEILPKLIPLDVCGLYAVIPGRERLRIAQPVGLDRLLVFETLERLYGLLMDQPESERTAPAALLNAQQPDGGSHLAVPLVGAGEVIGVLYACSQVRNRFQEQHLGTLSIVGAQLAAYVCLVRRNAELQALREQLAEEGQRRDEFVAMISHDIKNPLTAVRGSAQLLKRRHDFDEGLIDAIIDRASQIERLCTDLLDDARVASERFELRRGPVDLKTLVRECVLEIQRDAVRQLIRLDLPREPVVGDWDVDRLRQVCQNLLSNAIKYSPDGGEIQVRLERRATEVLVAVRDQGIGIPPAQAARLFDRFYRARTGEQTAAGTGLGLSIARTLVELHGGRIWAESAGEGAGSTFSFSLPYTG